MEPLIEKIESLITPIIRGEGLDLYDVDFRRESVGFVLRIYLINPNGSIGVDDCSKISRQISALLDVEDVIKHSYYLEVSSPGLTRKLSKIKHFKMSIGGYARVKRKDFNGDKRTVRGRIIGVEEDVIVLDIEGDIEKIKFEDVVSSNLELENI